MKQTAQGTVTLNLKLVQATRIETEFGNMGDIARAMRSVVNTALQKNQQATEKAPDDVLIPVTVQVTLQQARETLARFGQALRIMEAPADREIYVLVNKAINESEKS